MLAFLHAVICSYLKTTTQIAHTNTCLTVSPGGLVIAMFLKLLPLMTSTWSRPVVPLYDSPSRSSGIPPCCMDWVEEALSLRDKLATSKRESPA